MSHFPVMVVGEDPEYQLAPFHEFECTGLDDEFVKDVDITQQVLMRTRGVELDCDGKETGRCGPESLQEALGYYGLDERVVDDVSLVDKTDLHKYGYAVVRDGALVLAVDRTNPDRKWDYWMIGSSWKGFLRLLPGRVGLPGTATHRTDPEVRGDPASRASQARKRDVDWDGMRDAAEAEAMGRYRRFHEILAGRTLPVWAEVRDRHGKGGIENARDEYGSYLVIRDLQAVRFSMSMFDEPGEYERHVLPEDDFRRLARLNAVVMFAFLRDRQWHQRGRMGWWAMVTDAKSRETWGEEFNALLDAVPDGELISIVDCHI